MEQFHHDVLEVIRSTRTLSLPQYGLASAHTKKSEREYDVVTEVDQAIEDTLKTQLQKVDPKIAFVGEEFGGDRAAPRFWLVDPIDGTGLYIRGLIGCTTMVSLVEAGMVNFSAIYDFVHDELFYAVRGLGAYRDDELLSVSDRDFKNAYVAYETKLEKEVNMQTYLKVAEHCSATKHMSSGYEYALVAAGKIEGRIVVDPYGFDYDFAAGTLLVQEAGGVVTNLGSNAYDYKNLDHIAANPLLHRQLTAAADAIFPVTG